jgi:transcriptional regulator with XRE-family HTH domain
MTAPYAAFGRALRDAMKASGYTGVALAKKTGYTRSGISRARLGYRLPNPNRLAELVEVLSAPHLVTLARKVRVRACDECGAAFETRGGTPMRFCGNACRRRWHRLKDRERRKDAIEFKGKSYARIIGELEKRVDTLLAERAEDRGVFADFCHECEPDGLCRMASCVIQVSGRSPLPLADERLRVA